MFSTPEHLRDVLARSTARYVRLLPEGLQLEATGPVHPRLDVEIVSHGDARTLYRGRRPVCRSLDGRCSVTDGRRHCDVCYERRYCTPQVRVEMLCEGLPYRMLLAFTSARNFITYLAGLSGKGIGPEQVLTRLSVRNHERWGELCFTCLPGRES